VSAALGRRNSDPTGADNLGPIGEEEPTMRRGAAAAVVLAALCLCGCVRRDYESTSPDRARGADLAAPPDRSLLPDLALPCLSTTDDTMGIAVATTGQDAADCGAASAPCATIRLGLTRATATGRSYVFVAVGTYRERPALARGVIVSGGWTTSSAPWTRACPVDASLTTLKPEAQDGLPLVTASDLGGRAGLEAVTLLSDPTDRFGCSSYAVMATGATTELFLRDLYLIVGNACPGLSSPSPPPAGPPAAAGSCAIGPSAARTAGAPGTAGAAGAPGSWDDSGYHPQLAGDGLPGQMGGNGVVNGDQTTIPQCGNCANVFGICQVAQQAQTGKPGLPGCGGASGPGGIGGGGGGSAVGVFAHDAHVDLIDAIIVVGDGGKGGDASPGSAGGSPSLGVAGAGVACYSDCVQDCPGGPKTCICRPDTQSSTAQGATATAGAQGGNGGSGGGGAGGHSIGLVSIGAAAIRTLNVALTHGAGGKGGAGTNRGPDGLGLDRYP
jgi:hypothetical protein